MKYCMEKLNKQNYIEFLKIAISKFIDEKINKPIINFFKKREEAKHRKKLINGFERLSNVKHSRVINLINILESKDRINVPGRLLGGHDENFIEIIKEHNENPERFEYPTLAEVKSNEKTKVDETLKRTSEILDGKAYVKNLKFYKS